MLTTIVRKVMHDTQFAVDAELQLEDEDESTRCSISLLKLKPEEGDIDITFQKRLL